MPLTIAKWGNSLAIRIPQSLAKEVQLTEGVEVDLRVVDGSLVMKPSSRKRYSLDELVQEITAENIHTEIDSRTVMGNEFW